MKLLALCGLVAGALSMPQFSSSGPMPESMVDEFFNYAKGYQMIFASEDNWARLQQLFEGPQMRQFVLANLHKQPREAFAPELQTNWNDETFTADEFQALYPTLQALWEQFGMEPPVNEEWMTVDINKDGQVDPTELYATLRDTVSKKMFLALFSMFYQSATADMRGPFWTPAKKAAFERGPWGQILNMPEISEADMDKLAEEVAAQQGEEEADKFKIGMGMGGESSDESIPVQTKDGQGAVKLPVKAEDTDSDEPFIGDKEPILTTSGQSLPAGEVVDSGAKPVEGSNVMVTMPTGEKVPMAAGSEDQLPEEQEEQPKATIQANDGQSKTIKMPVISTTSNNDGTSTTTILNTEGSTMEVKMPTPKEDITGVQADEFSSPQTDAEVTDKVSGAVVKGLAFPAEIAASALNVDTDEAIADACEGPEGECKAMAVQTDGLTMIVPVATGEAGEGNDEVDVEGEVKMEVTNQATGEKADLDEVTTEVTPQGSIKATGTAPDGSQMVVEFQAPETDGVAADETLESPEGSMTVEDSQGRPLATATINRITTSTTQDGAQQTKIIGSVNSNPTVVTITTKDGPAGPAPAPENLAADELSPSSASMTVNVEGGATEELKVVEQTEEKISGQMSDGSILIVPTPEKATTTDFAGDNDEIKLEAVTGQELPMKIESVQTTPDKSAEQLKATTPNGAKMTVTVTGA